MPTIDAGRVDSFSLRPGSRLTLSVGSSAIIERFRGGALLDKISQTAGEQTYGPYLFECLFRVTALVLPATYSTAEVDDDIIIDSVADLSEATSLTTEQVVGSIQRAAGAHLRRGRVVKNRLPGARVRFSNGGVNSWTAVQTNGTADMLTDPTKVKCTTSNTTTRTGGFINFDFVAGQRYAISATLSNVSSTSFDHSLGHNGLIVPGSGAAKNVATTNGRTGYVFTSSETATRQVYAGINALSSAACANGMTLDVSEILIERIPAWQNAPSEFVPGMFSAEFEYECGNTLAAGVVTTAAGARRGVTQGSTCLFIGDSLTNDATDMGQLWFFATSLPVMLHCTASTTLQQAIDDWATIIAPAQNIVLSQNPTLTNSLVSGSLLPSMFIMERMINDILVSGTSFAGMQTLFETWLAYVASIGGRTVLFGSTPCKGHTQWTANKQTVMDQVDAWLQTRCDQTNYAFFFPRRQLLEDPANPGYLNPIYDINSPGAPDGLHTNAAGGLVVANALETFMEELFAYAPY